MNKEKKDINIFTESMRKSVNALLSSKNFRFNCPVETLIIEQHIQRYRLNDFSNMDDDMIEKNYSFKDLVNISYCLSSLIRKVPFSKVKDVYLVEDYFKWQNSYSEFVVEHNNSLFLKEGAIKQNQMSSIPKKVLFCEKEIEVDDHFFKNIYEQQLDYLQVAELNDDVENKHLWDVAIIDVGSIHEGAFLNVKYGSKEDQHDFVKDLPNMAFLMTENEKDILFVNWFGLWKKLSKLS